MKNAKMPLSKFSLKAKAKLILISLFGLFSFFISFELYTGSGKTLFIEHISNLIKNSFGSYVNFFCVLMMFFGAAHPFIDKSWNKTKFNIFMSIFKIIGAILGLMYLGSWGPLFLYQPNTMSDFLFTKLVVNFTFLVPIGSAFLVTLTDYGLMEFAGVIARRFMRPVYNVPGRAAIDAVASFVGSYSLALLITGKQYDNGYYSRKEAIIAATGFSTVSATFCIIVARTLGLMPYWNYFFWGTFLVTFVVTAITVKIYPISRIPNDYKKGVEPKKEQENIDSSLKRACYEGLQAAEQSNNLLKNMWKNFIIGLKIAAGLTPSLMSIGLAGLIINQYTDFFSLMGYIIYPFTWLMGFNEAKLIANSISMGLAEMLLPTVPMANSTDIIAKYVVGVTCISQILFFSANIPCMISVGIPISIKDILLIWYERVVLSILLSTPLAIFIFKYLIN